MSTCPTLNIASTAALADWPKCSTTQLIGIGILKAANPPCSAKWNTQFRLSNASLATGKQCTVV